jgi:hypothetical protein
MPKQGSKNLPHSTIIKAIIALHSDHPSICSHRRGLKNAEDIALSVLAVGQPSHARYLRFWLDDLSLVVGYSLECLVDGFDTDGANVSLDAVAGPRPLALQNAAIYSHLLPGAGPYQPVIEGTIPLLDLPVEYAPVECGGALWIIGVDFKMNYSGHVSINGGSGGYRFPSDLRLHCHIGRTGGPGGG